MSRVKQASQRSKAIPILGAAGLSLTLTSGVSAAAGPTPNTPARNAAVSQEITLREDEISDVEAWRHLCLRQRKSSRQAARLRLWWWLLPIRASAGVRAWRRGLFDPTASPDRTDAQTCSEVSINTRFRSADVAGAPVRKRVGQRSLLGASEERWRPS